MSLLLYPHGGSSNHGCEAIVRSTAKLTGETLVLASSAPEEDQVYELDSVCTIIRDREPLKKYSPAFIRSLFRYRALGDRDALDRLAFRPLLNAARTSRMALSIGGDNYCYGDNRFLYLINKELRKKRVQTVLWGCSVEPKALRGQLLEDLTGYDRIISRESLSYNALRANGLNRVELYPDPAFSLDRRETSLPIGFLSGNTVGVNISPLVLGYEKEKGIVFYNIITLIGHILRDSDMRVALIPHVVHSYEDDRSPLREIQDRFRDSERVFLVDDRPAEELKDIIARCRFLVAARTHACIAAYSSLVPVLALGYSTKAAGIAKDVMPADDPFVVPVQALSGQGDLSTAFSRLVAREQAIRQHLAAFIPDYIGQLSHLTL